MSSSDFTAASLLQHNPLPLVVVQADTYNIVAYSNSFLRLFSAPAGNLAGQNILPFIDAQDLSRFMHMLQQQGAENTPATFQLAQKESGATHVEIFSNPFQHEGHAFYQLVLVDVTEKLSVQQSVIAERDRYKVYIAQSSEAIYCHEMGVPMPLNASFEQVIAHYNAHSYISECNDAMARMYGYQSAADMEGMPIHRLIDFTDPNNFTLTKAFLKNGCRLMDAESHEVDRYGQPKIFLNNLFGIIEEGCLLRIWGTQRDITERKQIENKLKVLASLVEQTSDMLTTADLQFRVVTWNKAAENIIGLTAEQVIGKNIREYIDIKYNNATREQVLEAINTYGE